MGRDSEQRSYLWKICEILLPKKKKKIKPESSQAPMFNNQSTGNTGAREILQSCHWQHWEMWETIRPVSHTHQQGKMKGTDNKRLEEHGLIFIVGLTYLCLCQISLLEKQLNIIYDIWDRIWNTLYYWGIIFIFSCDSGFVMFSNSSLLEVHTDIYWWNGTSSRVCVMILWERE